VKKVLAFVLTFTLACALNLGSIGCGKKEETKADSSKPADSTQPADSTKPKT
jgi:hypothetical protein